MYYLYRKEIIGVWEDVVSVEGIKFNIIFVVCVLFCAWPLSRVPDWLLVSSDLSSSWTVKEVLN